VFKPVLWREELHNLHSSPNIRMVKAKRMARMEHVARMGEMKRHILLGRSEIKILLE
jgi:hypothetical protein